MAHNLIWAWIPGVPKLQACPSFLQPQWDKVFSHPFLNPVKRKQLVRPLAAPLTKYECRKAIRAPPLKWSRLAALACSCHWNSLRIEEAAQVRANLRNKIFNVGLLRLRCM